MTPKTGAEAGRRLSSPLTGPRIHLRGLGPSDVTDDYERWMNDPDVTRYTESRVQPWSRQDLEAYVRQMTPNPD